MREPGHHAPFTITGAELATWHGGELIVRTADVRVESGMITAVGEDLTRPGDPQVRAAGSALLPGLHDHHLHLLAMAASYRSLDVGDTTDPDGFDRAVAAALAPNADDRRRWLRVIGLHDGHGPVDRHRLDRLAVRAGAADRPIRVQHRSGAAWVLSSTALAATDLTGDAPDGWVHRADDHLASRWAEGEAPDLSPVGARLASLGVTGVTDATPSTDPAALDLLATARRQGDLPQRVTAMGGVALATAAFPAEIERGPVKILISDHELPPIAGLVDAFTAAHRAGRPVAVHCVTRVAAVLALTAWAEAGAAPGDRIEHGSVLPVELLASVAALGLTVVTQPGFVHGRGDLYRTEVEPEDRPHLYRCRSLLTVGIGVGGSTDAPFGPDDPWLAMATMVDRATATGQPLGIAEALPPAGAIARFLSPLDDPGGPPRVVAPGQRADLVLTDRPFARVMDDLATSAVAATWVGGYPVHGDLDC